MSSLGLGPTFREITEKFVETVKKKCNVYAKKAATLLSICFNKYFSKAGLINTIL